VRTHRNSVSIRVVSAHEPVRRSVARGRPGGAFQVRKSWGCPSLSSDEAVEAPEAGLDAEAGFDEAADARLTPNTTRVVAATRARTDMAE
jgi:hypothetical protein